MELHLPEKKQSRALKEIFTLGRRVTCRRSRGDTTGPERARDSASAWANTGRESATESASSTRASAKRDASRRVEATLMKREPRDPLPKQSRRDTTGSESARESVTAST